MRKLLSLLLLLIPGTGCALVPEISHQPQYHNPFPQLHKVAVLPFFNQSAEPTVDGRLVARHYYNELQVIPGFEVMPVGVVERVLAAGQFEPRTGADFQRAAQLLGVDAVVVGSVTEYSPYYPPRLGLAVNWYAANPGFHPVPAGYGLPWGTSQEEFIPNELVFESEFALAREQLQTQAPDPQSQPGGTPVVGDPAVVGDKAPPPPGVNPQLPLEWPNPQGFLPEGPRPMRPPYLPQHAPVLTHTRLFHGNDAQLTEQLANYFYFRDDARFGGWQAYLQRSEDFIRFCCYVHITQMLSARGGSGQSRVVWRWPIDRYRP